MAYHLPFSARLSHKLFDTFCGITSGLCQTSRCAAVYLTASDTSQTRGGDFSGGEFSALLSDNIVL